MTSRVQVHRAGGILIAGAGFVGSYIAAACQQRGLQPFLADVRPNELPKALGVGAATLRCDLASPTDLHRIMLTCQPRVVVVTAQMSGDGDMAMPIRRLVAASSEAGVDRVVLISSLAVYGAAINDGHGLVESTAPKHPSTYGQSKIVQEEALQDAARHTGVNWLVLRSTGVFGRLPAPRPSSRAAGAIDRVLRDHAAARPPLLTVENCPDQYLYARELGHIVAHASVYPPAVNIMNVGPGRLTSPDELRTTLSRVLGTHIALRAVAPTGNPIQQLNLDRLNHWFPERVGERLDLLGGLRSASEDFVRI